MRETDAVDLGPRPKPLDNPQNYAILEQMKTKRYATQAPCPPL
ncbi:MAG TPA: hypothetical protein VMW46_07325 [Candidatus Desulfaltia sp.]|nr:hypothetical protein [Candidatus Desulfaltia sp.]